MKFEHQVCSLELAKKLKELGFKQDSLFWWANCGTDRWSIEYERYFKVDKRSDCSAYTVAELGCMLPEKIDKNGELYYLNIEGIYTLSYNRGGTNDLYFAQSLDTEANVRAKMLIYLKENNLI